MNASACASTARPEVAHRPEWPLADVAVSSATDEATLSAWRELVTTGAATPYQSPAWFEAWMATVGKARGEAPLVLTARDEQGRATLILPLVVRSRAGVRVATFAGGKHANLNAPVLRRGARFGPGAAHELFAAARRGGATVDLFALEAMPAHVAGEPNPLIGASARPHTADSSLIDLDPARPLALRLSTSRRRRAEGGARRLARLGFAVARVSGTTQVERALSALAAHKAPWFRTRGLTNPFEEAGVLGFFAALASRPDSGMDLHVMRGPDGVPVAVAGSVAGNGRTSLMFVSYDPASPAAPHSPGLVLIRSLIASAEARGDAAFDFGLGEAGYKASLGAFSEPVVVVHGAVSVRGRLAAAVLRAGSAGKRALKRRPRLLAALLRAGRSRRAAAATHP